VDAGGGKPDVMLINRGKSRSNPQISEYGAACKCHSMEQLYRETGRVLDESRSMKLPPERKLTRVEQLKGA